MRFSVEQIEPSVAVNLIRGADTLRLILAQQQQTFPIALDPVNPTTLDMVVAGALNLAINVPGSGQSTFIYNQMIPAAAWTIAHNLSRFPSVSVVDSAGAVVEGDVVYSNNNVVTVTFIGAFSGIAYLN